MFMERMKYWFNKKINNCGQTLDKYVDIVDNYGDFQWITG